MAVNVLKARVSSQARTLSHSPLILITSIGEPPRGDEIDGSRPLHYEPVSGSARKYQAHFEAAVARRNCARTATEHDRAQRDVASIWQKMCGDPTAYFRDAYSRFSLLAQLGLSWWQDVTPLLTEDDRLPLDGVAWLLEEVRERRLQCQSSPTYEQEVTAEVVARISSKPCPSIKPEVLPDYTADDVAWFVQRKLALATFLETCLALGEEPVCSL